MSLNYKRRWIIEDLRDRYSVSGIAKRRGVSEAEVMAVWADWSHRRKLESNRRTRNALLRDNTRKVTGGNSGLKNAGAING